MGNFGSLLCFAVRSLWVRGECFYAKPSGGADRIAVINYAGYGRID
jgi:hypothetical protein